MQYIQTGQIRYGKQDIKECRTHRQAGQISGLMDCRIYGNAGIQRDRIDAV